VVAVVVAAVPVVGGVGMRGLIRNLINLPFGEELGILVASIRLVF
jgi:hypothetical protein